MRWLLRFVEECVCVCFVCSPSFFCLGESLTPDVSCSSLLTLNDVFSLCVSLSLSLSLSTYLPVPIFSLM
jgi:hypothetical protein